MKNVSVMKQKHIINVNRDLESKIYFALSKPDVVLRLRILIIDVFISFVYHLCLSDHCVRGDETETIPNYKPNQ